MLNLQRVTIIEDIKTSYVFSEKSWVGEDNAVSTMFFMARDMPASCQNIGIKSAYTSSRNVFSSPYSLPTFTPMKPGMTSPITRRCV